MKKLIAVALVTVAFTGQVGRADESANPTVGALPPLMFSTKNQTPLQVKSVSDVKTYAMENDYFFPSYLRDGMKVLYSASYGIGKEAAQARGHIVERNGKFLFKQDANPTMNLLLPPGLPMNNSQDDVSLWDIRGYLMLINRVAFSSHNLMSKTENDIYSVPSASVLDFEGGTAGSTVSYPNALEVKYSSSVQGRSNSNLKVYFAKGTGPVALEFTESMTPSGTFKFYLGQ
jgi:hypothetical protein